MKVFNVVQTSKCDGNVHVNVTPCADFETAKKIMDDEVNTLLSEETSFYHGIDLDHLEKCTKDEEAWDNDFNVDRGKDHIYITCNVDDYFEWIDIEEKEIVKNG